MTQHNEQDEQTPDYEADSRKLAKILRDGGYSYTQSARLIKLAREALGLKPPPSTKGAPKRLNREELEAFLQAAYDHSARRAIMMRTLIDTGMRVGAFAQLRIEHIDRRDLEIRVDWKGRRRDVPITRSLLNELTIWFGDRDTGWAWPSSRGGHLSKRRVQQIVKETAEDAGITKSVHPHLLRKTIAQRLADEGMPENHLQQFLGHEKPETTQIYYRPNRKSVKESHREAAANLYE